MVTISLTTTPKRIVGILPTVRSLHKVCVKRGWRIVLHVPQLFRNTQAYTIPTELHELVTVHRIDRDYGPITKYMGLLHMELPDDESILIVDDDALYAEWHLLRLARAVHAYPDMVHTNCGGLVDEECNCSEVCSKEVVECDYVIASTGVAMKFGMLRELKRTYEDSIAMNADAMYADDVVISRHMHFIGAMIVTLADTKRASQQSVPGVRFRACSTHDDALERSTDAKLSYTRLLKITGFWPWTYASALEEDDQTVAFQIDTDGLQVIRQVLEHTECQQLHNACRDIGNVHGNPTFGDKRRKTVDAPDKLDEQVGSACERCETHFRIFGNTRRFHWRLIGCHGKCERQPDHVDHLPVEESDPLPLVAIVALSLGAKLDVQVRGDMHTIPIRVGDALIFRADLVHAGSAYAAENWRLHCDILEAQHKTGIYLV